MSRKFGYPRNEQSRRDRIAQHEIIKLPARNHKARNDMLASNPHSAVNQPTIALTGTAIAGGVLESEIVTGSDTVIITVTGDTWQSTLGADNARTTAFLAAITGDLADAAGWNAEVALVHGNLARTSDTVMTLTLPATIGYSITSGDETVTVAPPTSSLTDGAGKGIGVLASQTFVITEGS